MRRSAWIVVGVLALASLMWWAVLARSSSDDASTSGAGRAQPVDPMPELAPSAPPRPSREPTPAQAAPASDPAEPAEPAPEAPALPEGPTDPRSRALLRPPVNTGDVAALAGQFERDSLDPAPTRIETAIRNAFLDPSAAPGLLTSVTCRQTMCKLELSWSAERSAGYMNSLIRLGTMMQSPFAIEHRAGPNTFGVHLLDLYQQRPR
jgi:hypothetical protein